MGRPRKEVATPPWESKSKIEVKLNGPSLAKNLKSEIVDKVAEQIKGSPLLDTVKPKGLKSGIPLYTDEWNEHLLSQLHEYEQVENNPTIDGLKRLVIENIGPVVYSAGKTIGTATESNGMRATVDYETKVMWDFNPLDIRTFGGSADCYPGNASDSEYSRFPTAVAETRAESRSLRKLLGLRRVVTAEEISSVPANESGVDKWIIDSQVEVIDVLCKRNKINVAKFINSGESSYKHFKIIPYSTALTLIENLNIYQRNNAIIPEEIKGYDENWKKNYSAN
jgi:hypothetical protein